MTAEFSELAKRYTFNRGAIGLIVDAFQGDDWSKPASPGGGNTPHWILGHIVATRRAICRKLGADVGTEEWEADFTRDASPTGTDGYPSPAVLLDGLRECDEHMNERLERMNDDDASESWGSKLPDGSSTLGAALHFLYFHESYHTGQLGLLRRIVGQPGFV